jgi:hypothetical protein
VETKAPDSKTIVLLFVAGAGLVVATFTYAFVRRWPTFDPLVTAGIVGVGLLLIVIYERLGHIHGELRTIVVQLDRLNSQAATRTVNDTHVVAKEPHGRAN